MVGEGTRCDNEGEERPSAHMELINMLEAVLRFAKTTQKVLCYCDSKSAVKIAQARYSATANRDIENSLREFDVACCQRNLVVRFRWQPRSFPLPTVADALSRGRFSSSLCNDARRQYFLISLTGFMLCLGRSRKRRPSAP